MDSFVDNYISSNTLALIVSGIIFIVTVALVVRNLISFVITCVLLFFAIVSGFAIANNDIVSQYLASGNTSNTTAKAQPNTPPEESTLDNIKARLQTIFHQLVETLSNHSENHKGDADKSKQLKSSIEQVLHELDTHRKHLQNFLDEHETENTSAQE